MATLATATRLVSQPCDEMQSGPGPTIPTHILVVNAANAASKIELKTTSVGRRILHVVPANGSAPGLDEITVLTPPGTTISEKEAMTWVDIGLKIWDLLTGGGTKSSGGQNCTTTTSTTTTTNGTTVTTTTTICSAT